MQKSPGEVVTRMYMDCNAGKYPEAEGYLSASAKSLVNGPLGALAGGMPGVCNQATQIRRLELVL